MLFYPIFAKAGLFSHKIGEVSPLEEIKSHYWLRRRQAGGPEDLQVCRPHLDPWESDGAADPQNHYQVNEGQENHQAKWTWIHQGEVILNHLNKVTNETTTLIDEGRAVDIVCLDFSNSAFGTIFPKTFIRQAVDIWVGWAVSGVVHLLQHPASHRAFLCSDRGLRTQRELQFPLCFGCCSSPPFVLLATLFQMEKLLVTTGLFMSATRFCKPTCTQTLCSLWV